MNPYYICRDSLLLLIKKGRGTWPEEALATDSMKFGNGANSTRENGIDKSDA
jgi:hypothetical protein